jgi:hypothetical protein
MEANTPNIQGRLLQSISQPKQWTASTGNKLRPVHGYENPTNQFNSGHKTLATNACESGLCNQ